MPYEEQLKLKQLLVEDQMKRLANDLRELPRPPEWVKTYDKSMFI